MTQQDKIISLARSFIGVKENPKNSNKNPFSTDLGFPPQAWCLDFVRDMFKRAGLLPIFAEGITTSYCPYLLGYAKRTGTFYTADYQPGDVPLFDWSGKQKSADHTGLIVEAGKTGVSTIEGNTSQGDNSNGGEVMVRNRDYKWITGVYRPQYNMEVDMDKQEVVRIVEEVVTAQMFEKLYSLMLAKQHGDDHPEWANAATEFAKKTGLFQGDGKGNFEWTEPTTRVEVAALFAKFTTLAGLTLPDQAPAE